MNLTGKDCDTGLRQPERASDDQVVSVDRHRLDVLIVVVEIQVVGIAGLDDDIFAENIDCPCRSINIVE